MRAPNGRNEMLMGILCSTACPLTISVRASERAMCCETKMKPKATANGHHSNRNRNSSEKETESNGCKSTCKMQLLES